MGSNFETLSLTETEIICWAYQQAVVAMVTVVPVAATVAVVAVIL